MLDRNERGHTLLIVDSTKMSSFLVNEARRLAEKCADELRRFTLGDGVSPRQLASVVAVVVSGSAPIGLVPP